MADLEPVESFSLPGAETVACEVLERSARFASAWMLTSGRVPAPSLVVSLFGAEPAGGFAFEATA